MGRIEKMNAIMDTCMTSKSKNPIAIMERIMKDETISMHGPEHHVLVGSSVISAYKNAGGEVDLEKALLEMRKRGSEYPGGSCGLWGTCGAAVSVGMAMSIITETTPLSKEFWGANNMVTANSLMEIGKIGGPRCCKRNSFTAVKNAVGFINEHYGVNMELPDSIICSYYPKNPNCLGNECPYYPRVAANG